MSKMQSYGQTKLHAAKLSAHCAAQHPQKFYFLIDQHFWIGPWPDRNTHARGLGDR